VGDWGVCVCGGDALEQVRGQRLDCRGESLGMTAGAGLRLLEGWERTPCGGAEGIGEVGVLRLADAALRLHLLRSG